MDGTEEWRNGFRIWREIDYGGGAHREGEVKNIDERREWKTER